jgi:arylsulfatase A-like enzyme
MKPNILFIVLDGLRSDRFYGSDKTSITPNIDLLIKKGVYFSQTICHGSCSVPSVASILTSLYPFEALVQDDNVFTMNLNKRNNIENFIDNGYTTYALHQEVLNFLGFKKIFDHVETYHDSLKLWNGLGEKIINFLKSNNLKQPWLYYVQIYDLHLLAYPIKTRLEEGPPQIHDSKFGNNHHERLISAMDEWIGKIIENVDLEKTLVIITSDHGSEVGDYTQEMEEYNDQSIRTREYKHGNIYKLSHKIVLSFPNFLLPLRKKLSRIYSKRAFNITNKRMEPEFERVDKINLRPYEKRIKIASVKGLTGLHDERYRVPLLIFGLDVPLNKKISQQVRSIDIFPTIMNLTQLDYLKTEKHGISLFPLIRGELMKELPAFLDGCKNAPKFIPTDLVGVRTSDYKYFKNKYHDENTHLYDLKNDPLEEYNIIKEKPDIAKKMNALLLDLRDEHNFNPEKTDQLFDAEIEEKIEAKLRKLGYI